MLSGMCTHSGTICPSVYGSPVRHQVLRDITRHFNRPFGNLLGLEHRRVIHQNTFQEKLYHISHTYFFGESSPLRTKGVSCRCALACPLKDFVVVHTDNVIACDEKSELDVHC